MGVGGPRDGARRKARHKARKHADMAHATSLGRGGSEGGKEREDRSFGRDPSTRERRESEIFQGDGFSSLCAACDDGGDVIVCEGGRCMRAFHVEKACNPMRINAKKMKKLRTYVFTCPNCIAWVQSCFVCGTEGKEGSEVFQCAHDGCGRFFHPLCAKSTVQEMKEKKFACESHTCSMCGQSGHGDPVQWKRNNEGEWEPAGGGTGELIPCAMCTRSYHEAHLPKSLVSVNCKCQREGGACIKGEHRPRRVWSRNWMKDGVSEVETSLLYCMRHSIGEGSLVPKRKELFDENLLDLWNKNQFLKSRLVFEQRKERAHDLLKNGTINQAQSMSTIEEKIQNKSQGPVHGLEVLTPEEGNMCGRQTERVAVRKKMGVCADKQREDVRRVTRSSCPIDVAPEDRSRDMNHAGTTAVLSLHEDQNQDLKMKNGRNQSALAKSSEGTSGQTPGKCKVGSDPLKNVLKEKSTKKNWKPDKVDDLSHSDPDNLDDVDKKMIRSNGSAGTTAERLVSGCKLASNPKSSARRTCAPRGKDKDLRIELRSTKTRPSSLETQIRAAADDIMEPGQSEGDETDGDTAKEHGPTPATVAAGSGPSAEDCFKDSASVPKRVHAGRGSTHNKRQRGSYSRNTHNSPIIQGKNTMTTRRCMERQQGQALEGNKERQQLPSHDSSIQKKPMDVAESNKSDAVRYPSRNKEAGTDGTGASPSETFVHNEGQTRQQLNSPTPKQADVSNVAITRTRGALCALADARDNTNETSTGEDCRKDGFRSTQQSSRSLEGEANDVSTTDRKAYPAAIAASNMEVNSTLSQKSLYKAAIRRSKSKSTQAGSPSSRKNTEKYTEIEKQSASQHYSKTVSREDRSNSAEAITKKGDIVHETGLEAIQTCEQESEPQSGAQKLHNVGLSTGSGIENWKVQAEEVEKRGRPEAEAVKLTSKRMDNLGKSQENAETSGDARGNDTHRILRKRKASLRSNPSPVHAPITKGREQHHESCRLPEDCLAETTTGSISLDCHQGSLGANKRSSAHTCTKKLSGAAGSNGTAQRPLLDTKTTSTQPECLAVKQSAEYREPRTTNNILKWATSSALASSRELPSKTPANKEARSAKVHQASYKSECKRGKGPQVTKMAKYFEEILNGNPGTQKHISDEEKSAVENIEAWLDGLSYDEKGASGAKKHDDSQGNATSLPSQNNKKAEKSMQEGCAHDVVMQKNSPCTTSQAPSMNCEVSPGDQHQESGCPTEPLASGKEGQPCDIQQEGIKAHALNRPLPSKTKLKAPASELFPPLQVCTILRDILRPDDAVVDFNCSTNEYLESLIDLTNSAGMDRVQFLSFCSSNMTHDKIKHTPSNWLEAVVGSIKVPSEQLVVGFCPPLQDVMVADLYIKHAARFRPRLMVLTTKRASLIPNEYVLTYENSAGLGTANEKDTLEGSLRRLEAVDTKADDFVLRILKRADLPLFQTSSWEILPTD